MVVLVFLFSLALAPIGPQGEVIRDNAQRMRERGFLLVDGKWVEPQMTLMWSELLAFERQGTDVQLVPAMSEKLLERFKNNRQVLAAVGPDRVPFQINARKEWLEGRQEHGVWLQLRAVQNASADASAWQIEIVHVDPGQFTVTAQRSVEARVQHHTIAARRNHVINAMTREVNVQQRTNEVLGNVTVSDTEADLTALLAVADETMAWRSWEMLAMVTDGGAHPLRPLAGDMVEASSRGVLMDEVLALLPRMVDRSAKARAAASAELTSLGADALPATLHLLDGPLLPEQRARLESFVAEHAIYRDDAINPARLRKMWQR